MRVGRIAVGAALVAGIPLGAVARLSVTGPPHAVPPPAAIAATGTTTDALDVEESTVLLAWRPGGLPTDAAARLADAGFDRPAVVYGETLGATSLAPTSLGPGWAIPVDVSALDPGAVADLLPADRAAELASLADPSTEGSGVVVARPLAERHGLDVGTVIRLAPASATEPEHELAVVAVVDPTTIGGAEVAVTTTTGAALGLGTPRYVLVGHDGDRRAAEAALAAALPPPLRFRAPGEVTFLREADAVPTQAEVKARFGEFALRTGTPGVDQDPAWLDAQVVTATVPVLGEVRCHRLVVEALAGAMADLEAEGLGALVDPATSSACWAPERVDGTTRLSRHAWGIAVDLNAGKHPPGVSSVQPERLVEIMGAWGFLWGGDWREPSPSYFEYGGPPGRG